MRKQKQKKNMLRKLTVTFLLTLSFVSFAGPVYAAQACGAPGDNPYTPSIDIGCKGVGNPITDMAFAIIRLLSDGVGLVVIASIVVAGIQYSTSQGDPQASARAQARIKSSIVALLIFIFAYAILNYVVPAGVLGT